MSDIKILKNFDELSKLLEYRDEELDQCIFSIKFLNFESCESHEIEQCKDDFNDLIDISNRINNRIMEE